MDFSVLDVQVSVFKDVHSPHVLKQTSLLKWLTTDKFNSKVDTIRAILANEGEAAYKKAKRNLYSITPSGTFTYRAADKLAVHNGLIAIDIDPADNAELIEDGTVFNVLQSLEEVAYAGRSLSGKGYWALIPIKDVELHKKYCDALIHLFQEHWDIVLDSSCTDVSRLRIYSYDHEAYFNHNARKFDVVMEEEPKPLVKRSGALSRAIREGFNMKSVDTLIERLATMDEEGQKYKELCKIGYTFGGLYAAGSIDEDVVGTALAAIEDNPHYADVDHAVKVFKGTFTDGEKSPIVDNSPQRTTTSTPATPTGVSHTEETAKKTTPDDTPTSIKEGIIQLVSEAFNPVFILDLVEAIPGAKGEYVHTLGSKEGFNKNVVIASGVSREFIDALYELTQAGTIATEQSSIMDVMFYGSYGLDLPVFDRKYRKRNTQCWMPMTVHLTNSER